MTINEKLFHTLNEKGLKQADLANYLNVEKSVITAWKRRGTNPPSEYIMYICKFLGISVYELLGEKTEYTSKEQQLINAYNKASPDAKKYIEKMLDIKDDNHMELKSSTSKIG